MAMTLEAEYAILGCMLQKGELIKETIVQSNHFYDPSNKRIFQAMQKVEKANLPIDLVTVVEMIGSRNLSLVGGRKHLSKVMNSVPSTARFKAYEKLMIDSWKLRQAESIQQTTIKTVDDIQQVVQKYTDLAVENTEDDYEHSKTLIDLYRHIEEQKIGLSGIDTGFIDLNNYLDGFQNKELIISAARPSVGKTAKMVQHAITHCANEGISVIFSLEMDKESLLKRMISSVGKINGFKMKNPKQYFNKKDWTKFHDALGIVSQMKLYIYDQAGQSVPDMQAIVTKLRREYPDIPLLVFIDYLQLIRPAGKRETRNMEVGEMTRSLKELAKNANVPIYLVSQLSRGVELRQDKRPRMSDIRDSGSVEQDADVIEFLYRDDYYDANSESENMIEVIIAKQRNGPVGTVMLAYEKEYNLFRNVGESGDNDDSGDLYGSDKGSI